MGIGLFFGQWFEKNHLLGAAIAIVCAIVLGIVVDLGISRLRGRIPDPAGEGRVFLKQGVADYRPGRGTLKSDLRHFPSWS